MLQFFCRFFVYDQNDLPICLIPMATSRIYSRICLYDFGYSGVTSPKLGGGANILTLSEQQYFIWGTTFEAQNDNKL